jgi:recombination protein RecT
LAKALPKHMSAERISRIALTCIRINPDLLNCTPESFLGALFTSAQIGIEPIAGRGYLLPFYNKRKTSDGWKTVREVQFILGYKGVIELFYRHSKAIKIDWGIVKEKDEFDYELGTNAYLRHKPAKLDRGNVVGYWSMAELKGGGKPFMYISKDDAIDHGLRHSKTVNKDGEFISTSPWVTDTDSMCLKTVLVQLAKLLPLSVELQRAIDTDETSRDFREQLSASAENVLDIPDTTQWVESEEVKADDPKPEEQPEEKVSEDIDPVTEKSRSNLTKELKKIPLATDWKTLEKINLHADNLYRTGELLEADLKKITNAVTARLEQLDQNK